MVISSLLFLFFLVLSCIAEVAFKLLYMVYLSVCFVILLLLYECILCWSLVFFKQIVPSNCRYEVLSTKIEIRLAKAEPIHWTSLEFSTDIVVPQRVNASSGDLRFILILEFPSSVCSSISCLVTLVKCYINDSRYNANKTYVKCYINDSRYNANKTWVKCYINDNRYNANESLACIYHWFKA